MKKNEYTLNKSKKSKAAKRDGKHKTAQKRTQGHKAQKGGMRRDAQKKPSQPRKIERIDLFGLHAVREALTNPERIIHAIYASEAAMPSIEEALSRAQKLGLKRPAPVIVEKARLDASLPEATVHQGVALSCDELDEQGAQDLIIAGEARIKDGKRSLVVILDQVTDPHNIGAIIRSASAFQATGLLVQRKHTPPLKGVAGKTACGGLDHLMIAHETNLSRAIERLKDAGYYVIGLDERGVDTIDQFDVPERCAFVLGAEGPGLRHLTKESCDELVKLPTAGAVGSLNVSNAAAISLYALSI